MGKLVWVVLDPFANVAGVFRSRANAEACLLRVAGEHVKREMVFARGDDYTTLSEGTAHIQCIGAEVKA